jgi:hypothetical protein
MTLIAQEIRTRVGKWVCITLKCFCTTKETIATEKRQPTEWEKSFSSIHPTGD